MRRKPRKPYKWTPEAVELLYSHWGVRSARAVAALLTYHTGKRFSRGAVLQKASLLGLTAESAQPYISMADAARELGLAYETLNSYCRRTGQALLRQGPICFLADATWEKAQAFYARPAEPTLSVAEAAERLGYTKSGIQQMVARGTIPFFRFGTRLRIPVVEVERREREARGVQLIGDRPARKEAV